MTKTTTKNFVWELVYRVTALILIVITLTACRRCKNYTPSLIMINYLLIQSMAYFIHHHIMEKDNEETAIDVFVYLETLFHNVIHTLLLSPNFKSMIMYTLTAGALIIKILYVQDQQNIVWRELLILMVYEILV